MFFGDWLARLRRAHRPNVNHRAKFSRLSKPRLRACEQLETRALLAVLSDPMLVGGVAENEAKVFLRTDVAAQVAVQYSDSPTFAAPLQTSPVMTGSAGDFTAI